MKLLSLLMLFLACSQGRETGVRHYDGYKVYSVIATSNDQYQVLWDLYTNANSEGGHLDFWKKPVINGKTDVMVAPEEDSDFLLLLQNHGIKYEIKIDNVQPLIDNEKTENIKARLRSRARRGNRRMAWDSYAGYSEMESFVQDLPQQNGIASVATIGQSYKGRNIYAVKISSSPSNRKAIVIDANIHACEWVTSASATWILDQFVTNTSRYEASHLNGIDYYILPNINPDGYIHSRTRDRMWRKTRSVNNGTVCLGSDPNRNFPFKFGGEGSSNKPCDHTYKGPFALSEPETKAVADFIVGLQNEGVDIAAYISFHSYGQLWLLPWGYSAGAYPPDYIEQLSLGKDVISAIRGVHGTRYITGTGADVLYGVGGASDDWAKSIGIKYTVTAEMRDADGSGFILPPSQIIPNAEEILVGISVVADRIRKEP